MGFVMAKYRSKLIAQRFIIEAVDARTSKECHKSHQVGPNVQDPTMTSDIMLKGITTRPTKQSAAAREAIR